MNNYNPECLFVGQPDTVPQPQSFYVASSFDGLGDAKTLMTAIRARGHHVTFDWTSHLDHACSLDLCGIASRQALARLEISAAAGAHWFIGCARLGKGTHVEMGTAFGYALAMGVKPKILLVGVWDGTGKSDSVFYEHADVRHVPDVAAAIRFIETL